MKKYKYTCRECGIVFKRKFRIRKGNKILCKRCREKNKLNITKGIALKIIKRYNIGCFNCGWNKSICDFHHIIPRRKGGSNNGNNLTYLCPNCHRLADRGKLRNLITLNQKLRKYV